MILSIVDLPAPFLPTNAIRSFLLMTYVILSSNVNPPNSTVRPSIEIIIVVFLNFACLHNRHSQNTAKVHIFTRRAYIRFRIKKSGKNPYQFYAKLQKTSGEKLPHSAIPHTIPCTPSVRQSCSAISSCVANPYFKDTFPIFKRDLPPLLYTVFINKDPFFCPSAQIM